MKKWHCFDIICGNNFIPQPTENFFSLYKKLCHACLEGGVAEGKASGVEIFFGKNDLAYTFFIDLFDMCEIFG